MSRRPVGLPVACAIAVAVGIAGGLSEAQQKAATPKRELIGLGEGFQPPPFSASDLSGQAHTLSDYARRVLVLHFWASWCPFCRAEIPKLRQVRSEWTEQEVAILAVSTDEELGKLKEFLAQQEALPYPVVADVQADFATSDQYGVSGIPVTYVIGRDGHIAAALHGSSDIPGAVREALDNRPAPPAS